MSIGKGYDGVLFKRVCQGWRTLLRASKGFPGFWRCMKLLLGFFLQR
jgi:hypothetical protein